jgi:type III restriction enzyme
MAKKRKQQVDFPFYVYLNLFYKENQKAIRRSYNSLTKKFLDFNDPDKGEGAFLRKPQFEALEMYVFLKEFLDNKYLYQIFEAWYKKEGEFEGRQATGINTKTGQVELFGPVEENVEEDKELFQEVFKQIKAFQQIYPNYIFALTMGLGKTILMATSIFYEFLLANKFPKDERFCHNALVFAPDKTVLQSLKEIQTFDKSKVVPPQYVNWLETHLKFYFLDKTGDALNAIDNSKYNIIISNTQKIILKRSHKETSPTELLFKDMDATYKAKSLNKDYEDLYEFDIDTDADLITNQRFAKLTHLKQLGIYVDEAHHAFGNTLKRDFGLTKSATSLRVTINELAENLKEKGSKVVGCYNYTGTPYVGKRLLPEVVYAYGLKDAIANKYLKKVTIKGFENVKDQTKAFVRQAIKEFWQSQENKRYEGMLPKMAFFASTIDELQKVLRPAVEEVLAEMDIPLNSILVNVGDPKLTTNDDLREFQNLDTPGSEKQFILLVNKGKEGWNCRSLFGVGLHRKPKSKVFVLQATMRCLRAIGNDQYTGQVFLAAENIEILEKELQNNFRLSIDELTSAGDDREVVEVRVIPPPVKVKVKRIKKLFQLKEKEPKEGLSLDLSTADVDKYKIKVTERDITDLSKKIGREEDYTHIKEKREFSELTLVAEISRYLNISPIKIKKILATTEEGIVQILAYVNDYNELLYDWIIPRLFKEFFDIREYKDEETEEIELVHPPKVKPSKQSTSLTGGYETRYGDNIQPPSMTEEPDYSIPYTMRSKPEFIVRQSDPEVASNAHKSFHVDTYCFDSLPEKEYFFSLLEDESVEKVWFTGMFTHGQSDFVIPYIDPESHTLRKYYPDFLVQKTDGSYVIIEVKADFQVDDTVVKAKQEYAEQLAAASEMSYLMVKATEVVNK